MKRLPQVIDIQAVAVRQRKRHPNRPLAEAQIQIRALLHAIDNIRDDALICLSLRVSAITECGPSH